LRRLIAAALVVAAGRFLTTDAGAVTIAIDAGHSAENPGATSARGEGEFFFNSRLASEVERALQARALDTRLNIYRDRSPSLTERSEQAKGADLLLSIHHDSVQPHYLVEWSHNGQSYRYSDSFRGFSLFISRDNVDPAGSLRCASAVGAEMVRAGFKPSRYHSEPIQGEGRPFADEPNGVHYFDALVVLRTAYSAAFLFEAGVIVNRAEEMLLSQEATRKSISQAVAGGIASCLTVAVPQGPG